MKSTRRGFLRTVIVSAGAASVSGPILSACGGEPPANPRPTQEVFPQSLASGDPRDTSIVLWTRALPVDPTTDAALLLELATDSAFTSLVTLDNAMLVAAAAHDHCVRVKVTGLTAGTTYYYRFTHEGTLTRTGRFRTAPDASTDTPIRFALASCQDYVGRFYNSWLRILDAEHDDLAFVVHVGDYVYETTGDPGFMMGGGDRRVTLRAPGEAIAFGTGEDTFYAARSVSNYRDLYRTYRSDPVLQEVHEKFAFICIWDDHEFSDDCWQDVGTYTDGERDETDMERRVNAEQVYFEYMPIAVEGESSGVLERTTAQLYPNTRLYRDFRFGRHVHLAMTDFRSFRPDHPTPEDVFPGVVVMDQAAVQATLARLETDGDLPAGVTADQAFMTGGFRTYIDLADAMYAPHQQALELLITAAYVADGVEMARASMLATAATRGKMDAAVAQDTITAGLASLPASLQAMITPIDPEDAALERGLAYLLTAKTGPTGSLGARYLVVQRTYELIQAWRARILADTTFDDALGATQEQWLRQSLMGSDATWKIVGNSVANTSLVLDLSGFAGALPPGLPPERFYLNVDHWDGFPERRRKLMREIYEPAEAVLLAGDIHSAYATDFGANASGQRVIEFTGTSISSGTFRELLFRTGSAVPAIRDSGLLGPVLDGLPGFLPTAFTPMLMARPDENGITVVSVAATEIRADFWLLAPTTVSESYYDRRAAVPWAHAFATCTKEGGHNGPLQVTE